MGYGYRCKCPKCGYMFAAFWEIESTADPILPETDTAYEVYRCRECGHYEMAMRTGHHSCIRCKGQLRMVDRFGEKLFEGSIACPNCESHLTAADELEEREWHTARRYRQDVDQTIKGRSGDEDQSMLFGYYPQGKCGEIEPIEWIVLKKEQGKMLLLSRYCLENDYYHDVREETTWEHCYIRKWLGREFLSTAFSPEQRRCILQTDITVGEKAEKQVEHVVQDKVFLLSLDEARELLGYAFDVPGSKLGGIERCEPTDYTVRFRKAVTSKADTSTSWWLRSPGMNRSSAAYVEEDYPNPSGDEFYEEHGIRPAMWIDATAAK